MKACKTCRLWRTPHCISGIGFKGDVVEKCWEPKDNEKQTLEIPVDYGMIPPIKSKGKSKVWCDHIVMVGGEWMFADATIRGAYVGEWAKYCEICGKPRPL